jgi:hypothetical protein
MGVARGRDKGMRQGGLQGWQQRLPRQKVESETLSGHTVRLHNCVCTTAGFATVTEWGTKSPTTFRQAATFFRDAVFGT